MDESVLEEQVVVDTVEAAGDGSCSAAAAAAANGGGRERRWCWLCLDEMLELGEAGKLVLVAMNDGEGNDVVEYEDDDDERTVQITIMMWDTEPLSWSHLLTFTFSRGGWRSRKSGIYRY